MFFGAFYYLMMILSAKCTHFKRIKSAFMARLMFIFPLPLSSFSLMTFAHWSLSWCANRGAFISNYSHDCLFLLMREVTLEGFHQNDAQMGRKCITWMFNETNSIESEHKHQFLKLESLANSEISLLLI